MPNETFGWPVLPYGSWPTPITSEVVVNKAVRLAEAHVDGDAVIWSESRPAERGRTALVRARGEAREELLPADLNARTAVHEYGGGAWWARDGVVWFAAWDDQRLYRRDPETGNCEPLTPEPALPRGDRYADGSLSPDGESIVCVREHHPPDGRGAVDVVNEVVLLAAHRPSTPEVLVTGPDFVSNPRFSGNGERLCWIEWDHPNMPWDGTRLVVRELATRQNTVVAGGDNESVLQPQWRRDGSLTFISDRTGWWNLYRWSPETWDVEPLTDLADAEIGEPQWVFGSNRYAVLSDGRIVFARWRDGFDGLGIRLVDGALADLELPFTLVRDVVVAGDDSLVVVAGTPATEATVTRVWLGARSEVARVEVLRPARDLRELGVDPEYISVPESISFPSADGRTAYGLLYMPVNPRCTAPAAVPPPLLVAVHGGPTGCARPELHLELQYLTSRGFAVLDLNYGGSTGYGRAYRDLLQDSWGIVDVQDSIAAAASLVERGLADGDRLCIAGGSAGGYTTLAVLARAETPFGAGADYFGVADLEAMAIETHKFESRYLDKLVGPYPEARQVYVERSPIYHVDEFSRPLLVVQGLEDEVVPPNQATMIVDALRAKRVPVAYIGFEGEQHGFRRKENIRRAIEAELSFYAQVFGFELPADEAIEPVDVLG
jgi:dipeptidyl aminopeptidase/acylaminoacyl peptidase